MSTQNFIRITKIAVRKPCDGSKHAKTRKTKKSNFYKKKHNFLHCSIHFGHKDGTTMLAKLYSKTYNHQYYASVNICG